MRPTAPVFAIGALLYLPALVSTPRADEIGFSLIGRSGGPIRSVAALDGHVLVGVGSQLLAFDTSIARRPRIVFESAILGRQIEGLAVAGQHAFVAAGAAGLLVYDITTPAAPERVGRLDTSGEVLGVAVDGMLAYLAAGSAGLRIVDVSDAAAPVEIGSLDSSFDVLDVAADGAYAYLTAGPHGLAVVDVGDPAAPVEVASLPLAGPARGLALEGHLAHVAAGTAGLRIIDVSDPLDPVEVGWSRKAGVEDAHDVTVAGGHAYVAERSVFTGEHVLPGGLRVVDVTVPSSPLSVGNLPGDAWSADALGQRVYVASYDTSSGAAGSLDVVSVADPSAPRRIGSFALPTSVPAPMVARGNDLYAVGRVLHRIDLTDRARPHIAWSLRLPGDGSFGLSGLAIVGDHALVGAGSVGMHVVDVGDPARPRLVTTLDTEAYDVAASGTLAFISQLYGGVHIVDVADPENPAVVGHVAGEWSVNDIEAAGGHLYVANYAYPDPSALLIYDITDPGSPVPEGFFPTGADGLRVLRTSSTP